MDRHWALVERCLDYKHTAVIAATISNLCFVTMDGVCQELQTMHGLTAEEVLFLRMVSKPSVLERATGTPNEQVFTSIVCLVWLYSTDRAGLAELFTAKSQLLWIRGTTGCTGTYLIAVFLIFPPEWLFGNVEESHPGHFLMGIVIVVSAVVISSFDILLVRKIGNAIGPVHHLAVFSLAALVVTPTQVPSLVKPYRTPAECDQSQGDAHYTKPTNDPCLAGSITGLLGQLAQVAALQKISGGHFAVLGYLQVPFAIMFQVVFTTTIPQWSAVVGMTVIILSGIWAATAGVSEQEKIDSRVLENDRELGMTLLANSEVDSEAEDRVRGVATTLAEGEAK
ncbi:hypothetical protein P7C73_g4207, partial [Tremellales sp. Uapishka_1]